MFGNSTTGRTSGARVDAVGEVMRHLRMTEGVPCLSDLDAGTIAAFRDFPHVQAVSVITEAEGAGLLDPARVRGSQASVGEWTQSGESSLSHLSRTLKVKGRPFVTIRLGLDVNPDDAPEVGEALDHFARVIEGVAEIWAEAVSARAEGRRAKAENITLNQLNRLQPRQ